MKSQKPVSIDELKSTFKHYDDEMETLATGYAKYTGANYGKFIKT